MRLMRLLVEIMQESSSGGQPSDSQSPVEQCQSFSWECCRRIQNKYCGAQLALHHLGEMPI